MKWRSRKLIIPTFFILLIIAAGIGIFFWQRGSINQQQSATRISKPFVFPKITVYPQNAPPTPGPGRMTYTNTKYRYSFIYPSQWKLRMVTNQNKVDIVQGMYQIQAGVNGYPFDISCQSNPQGLDAQSWFHQQGGGTGIGYIALTSGEAAYLDIEQGQVGVKNYILVHKQVVCSFGVAIANDANNSIIDAIVNSFKWQ
jgi:hypothetical protein